MKTRLIKPEDFPVNTHPATILFRSLEFKTIYNETKELNFRHPSMDLGCGNGQTAKLLFDEKFTYGLDNNDAQDVKSAIQQKIYKKVLIEQADKISLTNNSLNFVFCNSVLEHIKHAHKVLSEVSRVLKKNGLFLFTAPTSNFTSYLFLSHKLKALKLNFLAKQYEIMRNKRLNHFHLYTHKQWQNILVKHQLKVIKKAYCVSKEALTFWDQLALKTYFLNFLSQNANKRIYLDNKKQINGLYSKDKVAAGHGANLVALFIKQ